MDITILCSHALNLKLKRSPNYAIYAVDMGVKPTGNAGYKASYIVTLMAFPQIAIGQMKQSKGLKAPNFPNIQVIGSAIDEMNSPTDEQAALIRLTLEGRKMSYPDRYDQEELLNLHKAKMSLEQAIGLLRR